MLREYHEQLYVHEFDNLDKMEKWLKLTCEETENLYSFVVPITDITAKIIT